MSGKLLLDVHEDFFPGKALNIRIFTAALKKMTKCLCKGVKENYFRELKMLLCNEDSY